MNTKRLVTLTSLLALAAVACAQITAFNYQGQLGENGTPATGIYDLQFTIYDAPAGGEVQGGPMEAPDVAVTNGVFAVILDFGAAPFNGSARWLDIAVRPGASTGAYTNLAPRQPITATPYSIRALNFSGTLSNAQLAGTYGSAVAITNAANLFGGSFSGNGGGLTNLNPGSLAGTVPAAALSNAWRIGGNAGTTAALNFVGTIDNQPLEFRVNSSRALRLQPDTSPQNAPNVIGGSPVNVIAPGIVGVTIAGGGSADYEGNGPAPNTVGLSYGTVGGGVGNDTAGVGATVGGGYNNTSIGFFATVAGGGVNVANGDHASVGGGLFNQATNSGSTLAGGRNNRAYGRYSTVGGGTNGLASGSFSTVSGGGDNTSIGDFAVVGGGSENTNSGDYAMIGGGWQNVASALSTTVGGGSGNAASVFGATVAGGSQNASSGRYAFVGGGYRNESSGERTTVAGGDRNTSSGDYSTVGGGRSNSATNAASTIAGGYGNHANGRYSTVGGGTNGVASGDFSTVGGGEENSASAEAATVAGGAFNVASWRYATVGGGIVNEANAPSATVGGGSGNICSGVDSTIPGGRNNEARGIYSFAAGRQARADHAGAFVWAGSPQALGWDDFASTAAEQFLIRAAGGVGIGHNAPAAPLHVAGGSDVNLTSGGTLILDAVSGLNMALDSNEIQARNNAAASPLFLNASGGNVSIGTLTANARFRVVNATCDGTTWVNASDRNLKEHFTPVDAQGILAKVATLPIAQWNYTNAPGAQHIGPMAQDFQAAFGLGADDKSIATVDADGVALAAIQGLNQKLQSETTELRRENAGLRARLEKLERLLADKLTGGDK